MKKFKYYEATVTSRQILKVWMKVPASIDEEDVYLKAREIDGGNFVLDDQDWQFDDVIEIDEESDKMKDEPIEYTEEEFKSASPIKQEEKNS